MARGSAKRVAVCSRSENAPDRLLINDSLGQSILSHDCSLAAVDGRCCEVAVTDEQEHFDRRTGSEPPATTMVTLKGREREAIHKLPMLQLNGQIVQSVML